ncbi:MAG TPA: TIGR02680 family protein [Acidimicrobiales bacterium]|nr:TIGR02680 family protein [Acidimicrobiales bacterium]
MNDTVTVLSVPGVDRWRPTRAGLIGLWRYWDETFTFHRGRLLLRGANGSGKSMALELLLPFLLDADASPNRLTSAAKSRGGLYERIMTGSGEGGRTGFAWVEFRRGQEVFTVGARIRASSGTHKAEVDYFTAALAVGTDLHLLDGRREPLSRKGLVEALGAHGRVHSSSEEHRDAVRQALFPGFGPDRYASVITALLALRKEKLSQNLDPAKLSGVLSDALPPLDDHDLAAVAEGFERLDRRKAEIEALEAELAEVKLLAARQRDYARAVSAAVAGEVRSTETRRDDVTRAEREAADSLARAESEAAGMEAEAAALGRRLADLDQEIDALKSSDAYRSGATLDDLRAEVRRLRETVGRDQATFTRAAEERDRRDRARDEAAAEHGQAVANLDAAAVELGQAARAVGADGVVAEAVVAGADDGEHLVRAWARGRRELAAEIKVALAAHDAAVQRRAFAEAAVAEEQVAVDERLTARGQADTAQARARAAYAEAVHAWAVSCGSVGVARVEAVLPAPPDEPADVVTAVGRLAGELRAEQAVARSELARARGDIEDEGRLLADERGRLAEGRRPEPEPPAWRTERGPEREGAPLWTVVDVVPGVAAADVDGLEAALQASGLLDAWVTPDGSVALPDGTADVLLAARPCSGPTLAAVLEPAPGSVVDREVVTRVLHSVPLGNAANDDDREVVVGTDGTFRLGAATGRGRARPAELLGAAAQERHRLARLAEVDVLLARIAARLDELDRVAAELDRQEAAIAADLAALPGGAHVAESQRTAADAAVRLAEAETRLAAGRRSLAAAEDAVRQALRALTTMGARHGLPTTAAGLDEVVVAVDRLERSVGAWGRRAREAAGAERAHRRALVDAEMGARSAVEAEANLGASRRDLAEGEVRLTTLESAVGADYRELLDRIGVLDTERRAGRARERALAGQRPEMDQRIGRLRSELQQAEAARGRADEDRTAAHRRFLALAADGFLADGRVSALPPALDGLTAVLAAARAVAAELDGVAGDRAGVDRASNRVEERLHHARAALGATVDLHRDQADEGWWVLRAGAAGVRRTVAELATIRAAELAEGRAELAADEERLFEQTLAGSIRHALADRIRLANHLVDGINGQLAAVRTGAAGVAVQLRWEVDPDQPPAVKQARALLLRNPADLSDEERASLQEFVRARVDQARSELEVNAPWEARLREMLDYRAWHRFSLLLAHRDWQGFEPATARRLQRLSTGERSVALHLPMLASIAAHYRDAAGAPAGCPRLILLDELFAGVDAANRAQLFGTFTDWDLDAVFTSDHEWCQYATLDGIAIHHLHAAVADEPVTSTRFTWDGRRRAIDPPAA